MINVLMQLVNVDPTRGHNNVVTATSNSRAKPLPLLSSRQVVYDTSAVKSAVMLLGSAHLVSAIGSATWFVMAHV